MILEDPQALRLAESYLRMIALLGAVGEEPPEVPQAVIDHAIRRATISAFFRQAEFFFAGIGRAYVDAFVHYLGLRDPGLRSPILGLPAFVAGAVPQRL
jgi:hypothetical protein